MTETVKSLDYTKNILQTIPNNDTMEVVTETNAVKSPTDSLKATTLVYTVEEIAQMLSISLRSAYNLCNSTTDHLRVGSSGASEGRRPCRKSTAPLGSAHLMQKRARIAE